ncbi:MAG: disulfide bond formation protein B [Acidobacteriia bacterium]|nr:disulfide bond formation protein B [Terriglobia bacterium]
MTREAMRAIVVGLAGLGVAGQLLAGLFLIATLLAAAGLRTPLLFLRKTLHGYELWLACLVATVATGGSLFFSEVANFIPCQLCWYQRYCMYPLSITTLVLAVLRARRAARWLLPIPVVGAGISVHHLLIENGLAPETIECMLSAPGGCRLKWIHEFGYVTIPTLALTAFALVFAFLLLAVLNPTPPLHEP